MNESEKPLTKEIKIVLLQAIKRGHFLESEINTLCHYWGRCLVVEVIDKAEQLQ